MVGFQRSKYLALAAAGEDFDIYLGPDQRLQVKRALLDGDVEGSGVFSKKVTITNRRPKASGSVSACSSTSTET